MTTYRGLRPDLTPGELDRVLCAWKMVYDLGDLASRRLDVLRPLFVAEEASAPAASVPPPDPLRRCRVDRHPLVRAHHEATRAVDELPASPACTAAVNLVSNLSEGIHDLLDENAALRADVERLRAENVTLPQRWYSEETMAAMAKERDDLRARLAQAEQDTARLDWLEKERHTTFYAPEYAADKVWHLPKARCEGPTLRATIDAARGIP